MFCLPFYIFCAIETTRRLQYNRGKLGLVAHVKCTLLFFVHLAACVRAGICTHTHTHTHKAHNITFTISPSTTTTTTTLTTARAKYINKTKRTRLWKARVPMCVTYSLTHSLTHNHKNSSLTYNKDNTTRSADLLSLFSSFVVAVSGGEMSDRHQPPPGRHQTPSNDMQTNGNGNGMRDYWDYYPSVNNDLENIEQKVDILVNSINSIKNKVRSNESNNTSTTQMNTSIV